MHDAIKISVHCFKKLSTNGRNKKGDNIVYKEINLGMIFYVKIQQYTNKPYVFSLDPTNLSSEFELVVR